MTELKARKRLVAIIAPKLMANAAGSVIARADDGNVTAADGNSAHKADVLRTADDADGDDVACSPLLPLLVLLV
jgi:hypothetical protein